jgi:hypothetical protein
MARFVGFETSGSKPVAVLLAFGTSGLGSQVLAHMIRTRKLPNFSRILQIIIDIDVFQTFDIIREVFILDLQNTDQKICK